MPLISSKCFDSTRIQRLSSMEVAHPMARLAASRSICRRKRIVTDRPSQALVGLSGILGPETLAGGRAGPPDPTGTGVG